MFRGKGRSHRNQYSLESSGILFGNCTCFVLCHRTVLLLTGRVSAMRDGVATGELGTL